MNILKINHIEGCDCCSCDEPELHGLRNCSECKNNVESLDYWKEQCPRLKMDVTDENAQHLMNMYKEAISSSVAIIDRDVFDDFELLQKTYCKYTGGSSRMCELGTKSCEIKHGKD